MNNHPNSKTDFIMRDSIPYGWKCKSISNVAMILSSNVDKISNDGEEPVLLCNYMDVFYNDYIDNKLNLMRATATKEEIGIFQLKKNDVVITKDSETREDIAKAAVVIDENPHFVCGYHLSIIRPQSEVINGDFLSKVFSSNYLHRYFVTQANGVTRFGLTLDSIRNAQILIPPIHEQRMITRIIHLWDRAIDLTKKHIKAKRKLKKALMQQLLTGRLRFPGFFDKWQSMELRKILKLCLRKVKKPEVQYKRLGIRSHGKGTFITYVDDPEDISMTHLFKVKKGDLILNITFGWEGAIALVDEEGDGELVSHRFPTYEINEKIVLADYFKYLMLSPRFFYFLGVVSPGGAGRNRVLDKNEFIKLKVNLPSIDEQKKISALLISLDKEISQLSTLLYMYQNQKRGLMQKLLTGKLRVFN